MTLLVSLVALVAAAGVTGLRKDVQKNMCYAGAGVSGDEMKHTPGQQWIEESETCNVWPHATNSRRTAFIADWLNPSFPF